MADLKRQQAVELQTMPDANGMPRFSDVQLYELSKDFQHHKEAFEEHKAAQDAKFDRLAGMVEENTEATRRIAEAVEKQVASTAGVVRLYEELQAGGRWVRRLKTFVAWLSGVGVAGSFVAVCITYIAEKLGIFL